MVTIQSFELHKGEIAVIPTDTVYGLVAKAYDKLAVNRLYVLKNRTNKPGTVLAASIDDLVSLGIKRRYLKPVEHFWPNPISVVVPSELTLNYLDSGLGSLAVRIPKDVWLINTLRQTGPMLSSSANLPSEPPATTIEQARQYFGERVDQYIDRGELTGEPSTIVRIIDDNLEVLRQGAVKLNQKGEIIETK